MSEYSTTVSTEFMGPGPVEEEAEDVSLILEQKPFPANTGEVKTMVQIAEENGWEFIFAVGGTVISSDIELIYEAYYAQCGAGADGSITATIYVFKTPSNLSYNLVANWGEFTGPPITESTAKEESINFQLEQSVDLKYRVESIESIEWEGDVFNASGSVVYPPIPTLDGTSLVTNQVVYGTIRIKYIVFGDTWELNIPKREDSENNEYSSMVLAFYGNNQVETLNVTGPTLTGECGQTVQVCINTDCEQPADDDDSEEGDSEEGDGTSTTLQLVARDYCTGAVIGGAKFFMGGNEIPATGHTVKRGVNYAIKITASGYKDSDTDNLDNDSFRV